MEVQEDRTRRIRGDLAEFLLAVREFDVAAADRFSWRLQVYPFAVCVAPARLNGGFDRYLDRVEQRIAAGVATADHIGLAAPAVPTPRTDPTLEFAVEEARRRFCPAEGPPIGDPLGVLPDWQHDKWGYVEIDRTSVPWWWAYPLRKTSLPRFGVAATYVALAATPDLASDYMVQTIVLFSTTCSARDTYVGLSHPPTPDQFAEGADIAGEDLLGAIATSLVGLAATELGCPEDWTELTQ